MRRAVRRPGRARLALAVPVVAATLALPAPVRAEPMTTAGLTFSDELGGFEILSVAGSGTPDDPIVMVERVTADGPVTLVVRGLAPGFGNRGRTNHFAVSDNTPDPKFFIVQKVVSPLAALPGGDPPSGAVGQNRPTACPDPAACL